MTTPTESKALIEFLQSNPEGVFTADEIHEKIGSSKQSYGLANALRALENAGVIEWFDGCFEKKSGWRMKR